MLKSKASTEIVIVAPKLNAGSYPISVANFDAQYDVALPGLVYVAH